MEQWRPCPGFPLYEVSSLGRVKSLPRKRRLRPRGGPEVWATYALKYLRPTLRKQSGYLYVRLYLEANQGGQPFSVHELVCAAFHGPKPTQGHTVAHWDGNRQNNVAGNLRWATQSEQREDQRRHGTLNAGDRHYLTTIPDADIPMIRSEYVPRHPEHGAAAIARRYGVTRHAIGLIVRGINRK